MNRIKRSVPWWLRIGAKIALARLPLPYAFWKQLRLFEHGDMNQPKRAVDTFLEHARTAGVLGLEDQLPQLLVTNDDYTVLELGPGDSLFTAIIAKSLGATQSWLIDTGPFATTEVSAYKALSGYLRLQGISADFATASQNIADVLKVCNCEYMITGVRSLMQLSSDSVDYCFSNAVLEHIPNNDFTELATELFRVLKPDGVSVHRVDLKDHLGGGLNHLRFDETTWEGALFRNSGFYTNRIRFSKMISIFEQAGFYCCLPHILHWEKLPTQRNRLAEPFCQLPDDDLLVSGFDVVLKRKEV